MMVSRLTEDLWNLVIVWPTLAAVGKANELNSLLTVFLRGAGEVHVT